MIDTGVSNQEMSSCNEDSRTRSAPGGTGRVRVNRPTRSGVKFTTSSTECFTFDLSESREWVLGTGSAEVCNCLRDAAGVSSQGPTWSGARSSFLSFGAASAACSNNQISKLCCIFIFWGILQTTFFTSRNCWFHQLGEIIHIFLNFNIFKLLLTQKLALYPQLVLQEAFHPFHLDLPERVPCNFGHLALDNVANKICCLLHILLPVAILVLQVEFSHSPTPDHSWQPALLVASPHHPPTGDVPKPAWLVWW